MTVEQILTLLPQGAAAVAVVITVMLFLRHQSTQDVRLNKISDRCHNTSVEIMEGYKQTLKDIIDHNQSTSSAITERLSAMEQSLNSLAAITNRMIGKMD